MDSLSDIIKALESNPGAGGLTLGTMLILYRIARNVRADNREDNVQRQIDEWYKKMADSVDSLNAQIRALLAENAQLKAEVAMLKSQLEEKQDDVPKAQ